MRDNTEFKVGQFVRYNRIDTATIDNGRGIPTSVQNIETVVGKIVALHESNKRRVEVEDRETERRFRVVPRNIVEILPDGCVPPTEQELLAKEIGMFQSNVGHVKYLSANGREELMKHLAAINELFSSPVVNAFL